VTARFQSELHKRITEEISRLQGELTVGIAVKDYAQYREYVGKIAAYERVVSEFFEDVQTTLNKD
jgi:hypothetical protein